MDRFAEFALPASAPAPAARSLIMPPGYVDAIDPATGDVVAVRIQDQPVQAPAPVAVQSPAVAELESVLDKALRLAKEQPLPLPETVPQEQQGLPPVYGQAVVLGSIAMIATSGSAWLLSVALKTAAPELPVIPEILRWSLYLVLGVVAAVVVARLTASTRTGSDGTKVTAVFHRESHTHIGQQKAGLWKGNITNNVR